MCLLARPTPPSGPSDAWRCGKGAYDAVMRVARVALLALTVALVIVLGGCWTREQGCYVIEDGAEPTEYAYEPDVFGNC